LFCICLTPFGKTLKVFLLLRAALLKAKIYLKKENLKEKIILEFLEVNFNFKFTQFYSI